MAREKALFLLIDANAGFIDDINFTPELPGGHMNLCIPGAKEGAIKTANLIRKGKDYWYDFKVTKDSHHPIHIASPIWHVNKKGQHPDPFTQITLDEYKAGEWRAYKPGLQKYTLWYLEQLELKGRYKLITWPPHCIIGTPGQLVEENIRKALFDWEMNFGIVGWKIKGDDPYTEHYAGTEAEVPNPKNPSSQLDVDFIAALDNDEIDIIYSAGWALSHCKAATVRSILNNSADKTKLAQKWVILEDCTCSVPGFESEGEAFLAEMKSIGVRIEKSTNVL